MKEFIELFKNLMANKRYRSLAILLLYVIFFSFVFMLFSTAAPKDYKPVETPKEEQEEQDIRTITEYYYEINGSDNFIVTINNDSTINYNDTIYPLNEKPIELEKYDLSIFTMDNIYKLLEKGTLASTNYLENSNTYLISITDFEQIIYQNEIENEEYINIITYNEEIDRITIDFNGYYDYTVNIDLRS